MTKSRGPRTEPRGTPQEEISEEGLHFNNSSTDFVDDFANQSQGKSWNITRMPAVAIGSHIWW